MCILLLMKFADFLQLMPARACVVEQIAQFGGIWLDFLDSLLVFGVALEDQDLVLGTAFLACRVNGVKEGAHGE
jgi:hypothetical protein